MVQIPSWPALALAAVSIAAKEWLFQITKKVGDALNSQILVANAWHHRSDAFSSILSLISIAAAMSLPGFLIADSAAGMLVAGMICLTGSEILSESVKQLTDTSDKSLTIKIESLSTDVAGVSLGAGLQNGMFTLSATGVWKRWSNPANNSARVPTAEPSLNGFVKMSGNFGLKPDGTLFRYNLGPRNEGFVLCPTCGCSAPRREFKKGAKHQRLRPIPLPPQAQRLAGQYSQELIALALLAVKTCHDTWLLGEILYGNGESEAAVAARIFNSRGN